MRFKLLRRWVVPLITRKRSYLRISRAPLIIIESARITGLYDRRNDTVALDGIEKIAY